MSKYDRILHLPHHVSATRPQMSLENRAAQFSPFAALSGYDAAISETARQTDARTELDEDAIADLDRKLQLLKGRIAEHPEIAVTYFVADPDKEGGAYVGVTGALKKIDDYEGVIVLVSGERVPIVDLVELESELFR